MIHPPGRRAEDRAAQNEVRWHHSLHSPGACAAGLIVHCMEVGWAQLERVVVEERLRKEVTCRPSAASVWALQPMVPAPWS